MYSPQMLIFILMLCVSPVLSTTRSDWSCMHLASVDELKSIVREYSESFPCEECRNHFNDMLETHAFPLEHVHTDEEARIWSWLTHNMVNVRIGKRWEPFSIMDKYTGTCDD